ncbi:MAG: nicotinate (nicotinamide) nucleotide adenylyltransferase [bacterium]
MHIGLFGGSFNPPHLGHMLALKFSLETGGFDRIYMLPCGRHAFDKSLVAFEHRRKMCELACEEVKDRVEVLGVENEFPGVSYTIDTVRHLQGENPYDEFTLIVGSDLRAELDRWKEIEELRRRVDFFFLPRPTAKSGEKPSTRGSSVQLIDVSSSEVRERFARGQDCAGVVSAGVLEYIRSHGLYQAKR